MCADRHVYLDHSATTPTDPRVVEAMLPYFSTVYGNASSAHSFGRDAEKAINDARETIARIFNCDPMEVVFTSGGSEANNLAVRGMAWTRRQREGRNHLLTTPVEHSAVGRTVTQLAGVQGFTQTLLPVDAEGRLDPEDLAAAITEHSSIGSVIYANNEVGSINPIPQLAEQAHALSVLLHTDAVQAAGQLTLDVQALGVDLMSISGHKFYGPKGVGALYVRKGLELTPSHTGGSHEEGRRPGTHNTPFIVGMAKALELAYVERDQHLAHYQHLRDMLTAGIMTQVPDARLTGHPDERLPSHTSFVFPGVDSTKLVMHLDVKGIAASGASACKTGNAEPSAVLLAMGLDVDDAIGSLRLSVGRQTTEADVEYAVPIIAQSVERLRKLNRQFL